MALCITKILGSDKSSLRPPGNDEATGVIHDANVLQDFFRYRGNGAGFLVARIHPFDGAEFSVCSTHFISWCSGLLTGTVQRVPCLCHCKSALRSAARNALGSTCLSRAISTARTIFSILPISCVYFVTSNNGTSYSVFQQVPDLPFNSALCQQMSGASA